ncbi:DUF397 domain-containing protein [Streptomyces arboris]
MRRRRLGAELKRLREKAGVRMEDAAERIGGADGAFNIYSYPDPMDLDVVNLEYLDGALYSGDNGGSCVETQPTPDGLVAVGDSKDRTLGAHTFAPGEWQAFVTAVRDGSL